MPTGAKIIAALSFAALCWLVSGLIPPLLPEGTPTPYLQPVNAFVGFVMGWRILGGNAGRGIVQSIGHASTATVASIFWCLLIWSGELMLTRSMRLLYNGPIEALQDMAVEAIEYIKLIATPEILIALLVGTFVTAFLTEGAAKRWA
ncbi:MAG: TrgA family protein [Pseudomonadota bacterium]